MCKLISPWCRIYAWRVWVVNGLDNGLPPIRHQAIISTNDDVPSTTSQGTYLNKPNTEINQFSLTKLHLKVIICNFTAIFPGEDELI